MQLTQRVATAGCSRPQLMAHEQDTVAYAQAKQGGTNCKGLVTSLFQIRSWNGLFYPEKHSFLVLQLHKTRTLDYFFY